MRLESKGKTSGAKLYEFAGHAVGPYPPLPDFENISSKRER